MSRVTLRPLTADEYGALRGGLIYPTKIVRDVTHRHTAGGPGELRANVANDLVAALLGFEVDATQLSKPLLGPS